MILALAIIGGVVITLLTGLVDNTPEGMVGAVRYGYPIFWLVMIVVPGTPYVVRWLRFFIDIVAWTVVVWVILFLISRARSK
jgi:hypothetical protein